MGRVFIQASSSPGISLMQERMSYLAYGALLESTGLMDPEQMVEALHTLVKNKKYFDLDLLALQFGQDELRRQPLPRVTTTPGLSQFTL